jgi:hypothetical protein
MQLELSFGGTVATGQVEPSIPGVLEAKLS